MYGTLVISYLFLGGTAAGGMFAMAAWSLMRSREAARNPIGAGRIGNDGYAQLSGRTRGQGSLSRIDRFAHPRGAKAFERLQARVYPLCLALLALAIVCLFWDLERPERVLLVLLQPHVTVITFGAFCLSFELLCAVLLTAATLFRADFLRSPRCKRALEVICCVLSVCTMAYTGAFLYTNIGVAFWNTWAIVAVFTCSSLSCGLSLLLLVDYFMKDHTLLLRAAKPLQKLHLACLAAESVAIAAFVFAAAENPAAAGGLSALTSPSMLPTAVVGVLGFGIAAPAVLETYSLSRKECRTIPVSDVFCLFGGLVLRFVAISCGIR